MQFAWRVPKPIDSHRRPAGSAAAPRPRPDHAPTTPRLPADAPEASRTGLDARRRGRHGPPNLAPLAIRVTRDIYPS